MTSTSPTSLLTVDQQPGKPPMLQAEAPGDAERWAAEHKNALHALVAEHGSLLVRGLGLHDAAVSEAVFQQLGTLMPEMEAFAPRRRAGPERAPSLRAGPAAFHCRARGSA